ncbi:S8 family peptidase [Arthrobacter sp. 18067]|uniref:S8 family peptidase n=1 Tax=Arthrobacter sp. 18067 TaxID=2681413 RepID=UPI0013575242|nr:S8 family peptidase [Arthrobacter sp. 18067]
MAELGETGRPFLYKGEALRTPAEKPPAGGGDKFEPQTAVQARAILLPQIRSVREEVAALDNQLRVPGHTFIEAKLLPNYLAASSFPGQLINKLGAMPVGSRAEEGLYVTATTSKNAITRRLVLSVPDDSLAELEHLIESQGTNRSERAAFEEIRKLDELSLPSQAVLRAITEVENPEDEIILWETVLNPIGLQGEALVPATDAVIDRWAAAVENEGGSVERGFIRQVGGLTFVPVRAAKGSLENLSGFNALRIVRPMPAIPPRPIFGTRSSAVWHGPGSLATRATGFKIAVFDGGLNEAANSKNHMVADSIDLTGGQSHPDSLVHGTAVTGAALYGLVRSGDQTSAPPLPLDSFRVLPAPAIPGDMYGYWVLDRIKEVVSRDEHKIINLSLGPTLPVKDDLEPNRWTSELDTLAWERDVMFIVAAGNDGHLDPESGRHRVQVPADMVNGFSVGACDVPSPDRPWHRSSYSSVGPGRWGGRVQPLGVQFGGSDAQKFPVLAADGTFLEATGTSFAAPLVTYAMSELAINLPTVNTNVLRAFGVHFAERPARGHKQLQPEVGYGRIPSDFLGTLTCSADEAHVLYKDSSERGELHAYKLPVPRGLSGKLEVRITLAYLSPVEPTEATEYTRASIDLTLRPHAFMHRFTSPHNNRIFQTLDRRSQEALQLIGQGWRESQEPVTKSLGSSSGRNEASLREGGKWETLRHYRFTLSPDDVEDPRIELTYLTRGRGQLDNSPSKLPFALLISVTDTSGAGQLYDSAVAQFRALQPAGRTRARVGLRSQAESLWEE